MVVVVFASEKLVLKKDPVYKYHKMCVAFFKINSFSLETSENLKQNNPCVLLYITHSGIVSF